MDEPWESSIVEYGAVNVTGFRIVNPTRRYVRDFLKKWTLLDPDSFPGAGRNYISVSFLFLYPLKILLSTEGRQFGASLRNLGMSRIKNLVAGSNNG